LIDCTGVSGRFFRDDLFVFQDVHVIFPADPNETSKVMKMGRGEQSFSQRNRQVARRNRAHAPQRNITLRPSSGGGGNTIGEGGEKHVDEHDAIYYRYGLTARWQIKGTKTIGTRKKDKRKSTSETKKSIHGEFITSTAPYTRTRYAHAHAHVLPQNGRK